MRRKAQKRSLCAPLVNRSTDRRKKENVNIENIVKTICLNGDLDERRDVKQLHSHPYRVQIRLRSQTRVKIPEYLAYS